MNTTIRLRTPEDDEHIINLWNTLFPEFPPETVEEFRHQLASNPPDTHRLDRVAVTPERVAGTYGLQQMYWTADPTRYSGNVIVNPEARRQGVGRGLYDDLLDRASDLGATRIYSWFKDGDAEGERFAQARGFSRTGKEHRMSRLDVRTANLDGYDGLEEKLRADGISITTLSELGPSKEVLHAVHQLDDEVTRDVPMSEEFSSTPYDTWYAQTMDAPGASADAFFLAMQGDTPVAMANLRRQGHNAAWNQLTGVLREYRGRGVARALKGRTIQWSRQNGVDFIFTGNDVSNTRMLAVNIRLGYQPLPPLIEVSKNL